MDNEKYSKEFIDQIILFLNKSRVDDEKLYFALAGLLRRITSAFNLPYSLKAADRIVLRNIIISYIYSHEHNSYENKRSDSLEIKFREPIMEEMFEMILVIIEFACSRCEKKKGEKKNGIILPKLLHFLNHSEAPIRQDSVSLYSFLAELLVGLEN